MDKANEKLIETLWKMVDRSNRWIEDAESRDDWNDTYYYIGQKHLANELIRMLGGSAID